MSESKKRISAKTFGDQLYGLAKKISEGSVIGTAGGPDEKTRKVVGHHKLFDLIATVPELRDTVFLEEIIFNLWVAAICLETHISPKNHEAAKQMFSSFINDTFSRTKTGISILDLSQKLQAQYQDRFNLYIDALGKDKAKRDVGPTFYMVLARISAINSAVPIEARILGAPLNLLCVFQTEWLSTLACFQSTIDDFDIINDSQIHALHAAGKRQSPKNVANTTPKSAARPGEL